MLLENIYKEKWGFFSELNGKKRNLNVIVFITKIPACMYLGDREAAVIRALIGKGSTAVAI